MSIDKISLKISVKLLIEVRLYKTFVLSTLATVSNKRVKSDFGGFYKSF